MFLGGQRISNHIGTSSEGQRALPLVWVVIVNWNRLEDTSDCLSSILGMEYPNYRVLVVDNGSTDGSPSALRERFPKVTVLEAPANLGFAAGNNLGIRYALARGAQYILLLNNDTVVDRDMLAELVAGEESDPSVGIVGPKIYYFDDPQRIWFAGADRHPLILSAVRTGRGRLDGPRFAQPRRVGFICGAAMLVKRCVWEEVGLLDEGFFMYYEDADFCLRAIKNGFELLYVPTALVWHKVASSSGGVRSPAWAYYMTKSSLRFFRRHARGVHLALILLVRSAYLGWNLFREVASGHLETARLFWRGFREGLSEDGQTG